METPDGLKDRAPPLFGNSPWTGEQKQVHSSEAQQAKVLRRQGLQQTGGWSIKQPSKEMGKTRSPKPRKALQYLWDIE